jgi:hypothetical protein
MPTPRETMDSPSTIITGPNRIITGPNTIIRRLPSMRKSRPMMVVMAWATGFMRQTRLVVTGSSWPSSGMITGRCYTGLCPSLVDLCMNSSVTYVVLFTSYSLVDLCITQFSNILFNIPIYYLRDEYICYSALL